MQRSLVRLTQGLIPANTPDLVHRGNLWWKKHKNQVIRSYLLNPYWKHNAIVLREHAQETPATITEKLLKLDYSRVKTIENKGEFAVFGGTLRIAPIHEEGEYLIEFLHNTIGSIWKRSTSDILPPKDLKTSPLLRLHDGDYVTHHDHGIGIWRGNQSINGKNYYILEYAPPKGRSTPDTLSVPESAQDKIHPYVGFRAPSVHRLGGSTWVKTIKKATRETREFAEELLRTHADRLKIERPRYIIDEAALRTMEETFPYELTDSQKQSLAEIFSGLAGPRPIDHLLLGDVGFGKTEIAAHVALQVALSGKQVAILAPTTVLASQHENTFTERLKDFPVIVEGISRLKSPAEQKKALEKLKNGKIDIVIGTHRLLSQDIVFKNLGMLIVDEEQRFGVAAKEKLKKQGSSLDILTLSATPLPRTLQLTLGNIKALSTLRDAPLRRKAPQTRVLPYNIKLAEEAISFELARKGQVYFLANRINTIPALQKELQSHFPNAHFGVLHGRLKEETIAQTMNAFRAGKIDVLISTTIIENGIDLHSANTLIVHDATYLGLAEAHQLRGRVGRGDRDAFAYFCYPKRFEQTQDYQELPAFKRLVALLETQYLGSGEDIARRDLELRGAGNILGKSQSGTAHSVGLGIYSELLRRALENQRPRSVDKKE